MDGARLVPAEAASRDFRFGPLRWPVSVLRSVRGCAHASGPRRPVPLPGRSQKAGIFGQSSMIEKTLDIATKDGQMGTFICHPERGGPVPAIFLMMDAPGIREELRDMARRLATAGYYVLLPHLYYRAGRDAIYGPDVLKHGSEEHQRMRAVRS